MMRLFLLFCVMISFGCGKPIPNDAPKRPTSIMDFDTLYSMRCAACHGTNGAGSGSIALNDAALLSLTDKKHIRDVIKDGRVGTLMPSFQSNSGDPLTDAQIDVIVDGMKDRWGKNPPPWVARTTYEVQAGNPSRGRGAFVDMCGQCHGHDGLGGTAGAILIPVYLDLVSNQYLRTVILCGRPELGMAPQGPNSDNKTINDIVAWLQTHRTQDGSSQ